MDERIEAVLKGEKTVARATLQVLTTVDKHLSRFDGKRATTMQGCSTGWNQMVKALYDDCRDISKARLILTAHNRMSTYLKIDITQPTSHESVEYFERTVYVGQMNGGDDAFEYAMNMADVTASCEHVLAISPSQIRKKRDQVAVFKDQIDRIEDSVPLCFKSLVRGR